MSLPLPGTSVRGSQTGKPIMALFDLLGRTWALGILWNLHDSPATFRELQIRCEHISPTLLNSRLKELRATLLVEKTGAGYALTHDGFAIFKLIEPMGAWSRTWQKSLQKQGVIK